MGDLSPCPVTGVAANTARAASTVNVTERIASWPLKPGEAVARWDEFLGPGPQLWTYHEVVVKGDRVYDGFTGPNGLPIDQFKSQFTYADDIDFGF